MRRLAAIGVVIAGNLALHELAYRGAHGSHAAAALDAAGHGYLGLLGPVLGILAPVLIAVALIGPALIGSRSAGPAPVSRLALWLPLAMLALFAGQELFEAAALSESAHAYADLLALLPFAIPMAFALGAPAAIFVGMVWRQADRIAGAAHSGSRVTTSPGLCPRRPVGVVFAAATGSALSSGFARRPPPVITCG